MNILDLPDDILTIIRQKLKEEYIKDRIIQSRAKKAERKAIAEKKNKYIYVCCKWRSLLQKYNLSITGKIMNLNNIKDRETIRHLYDLKMSIDYVLGYEVNWFNPWDK